MPRGTKEASERPQPLTRLRSSPSSLCIFVFLCLHSISGGAHRQCWVESAHLSSESPSYASLPTCMFHGIRWGVSATSHQEC